MKIRAMIRQWVRIFIVIAAPALAAAQEPTVEEAEAFIDRAESELLAVWQDSARASWVQATYITEDTEILAAKASETSTALAVQLAHEAARFQGLDLPYDLDRKLRLLPLALTVPAPNNAEETRELALIETSMESAYGRGKYCPDQDTCWDLQVMSKMLVESRDENHLREVWKGWRTISPPMREEFARYVELGNKGARELGFADLGSMWRSQYDMPPDAFAVELDRLWNQVKPLYVSLHAYVRRRLRETYGPAIVPANGPMPAHLLGNMWAQQWGNIYPLVAPKDSDPGYDLTEKLVAKRTDALEMVRYGERFFLSLGFEPLPETFWKRSLFVKPRDRDVVCHASAWSVDAADDLRIKMCIDITAEDFSTIHHELGHNFYQRAYMNQPPLYRGSANDGFHEAIGDTLALSVTPAYLKELGLIDEEPDTSKDIGLLLRMALDKVAFLPFGLLVDQWRWRVFSGEVTPAHYNEAWWELKERYQGVVAPVTRSEADFDPGAKYHVPASVPYSRYFLAHILQFQFHRALCKEVGYDGPLNRCTIYGNKAVGERLNAMLEMGLSRPWPEALEAVTGETEMDATAIIDYFAPLKAWLDEKNEGHPTGW
ncbi:MAG: M2 family metallopeptidase [Acidobacteriota bacterium]|nr:MAG: M2 family metallopeptidase [Acidobacteriota bacterium]